MQTSGKTIFITGGGSGIGRALAHRLHDLGNVVIVAGRRRSALEETVRGRTRMAWLELDVTDAESVACAADRLITNRPELDVLLCCAGVSGREDPTIKRDLREAELMIATNLLGPIRIIDALIDHLKSRPDAAILVVSSGTGFVPYPAAPTYSASKAALHSYTASLRALLRGKIQVTEIVPPQVATDLMDGLRESQQSVPLDKFADEVISSLTRDPARDEILVEEVKPFRFAERDGSYDQLLDSMTPDG